MCKEKPPNPGVEGYTFTPVNVSADPKVPLHSIEAEMSVLGSMILSSKASEQMVTFLDEDDFYRPAHRLMFRAMKQLISNHKEIDIVTLKAELVERGNLTDVGGVDNLIEIAEFVPSAANAEYYAEIVKDRATLRRLEGAANDIIHFVRDTDSGDAAEKVDKAEQVIFEVGRQQNKKYFTPVSQLAKEFFVDVDNIVETGAPMQGLKCGFTDVDRMTTGFYPGDFVIIGGRPAMGKTSLVLDFAVNVAQGRGRKDGKLGTVAIFSLEMSGIQLVRRMASMLSGISMGVLKQDKGLSMNQYQKLADGCETLYSLPIFIDDGSDITPLELRGKCRRLKAEHGLDLVVIDYLQLMKGGRRNENRVQEISEIARACKSMAKELECPVIALSQLSRAVESRDDKRPQLSDIRESGSIEAEADLVMLLYRDSYYKSTEEHRPEIENFDEVQEAEVIVAKHRNGPTGKVMLGFQPAYARYRNLDRSGGNWSNSDE